MQKSFGFNIYKKCIHLSHYKISKLDFVIITLWRIVEKSESYKIGKYRENADSSSLNEVFSVTSYFFFTFFTSMKTEMQIIASINQVVPKNIWGGNEKKDAGIKKDTGLK